MLGDRWDPVAAVPTVSVYRSLSIVPLGALTHLVAMALQRAVYRPLDAEHTVLHQVIAEHRRAPEAPGGAPAAAAC